MAEKRMTKKGQQGNDGKEVLALIYKRKDSEERTARVGARTARMASKIFLYW